jgi:hypothetical protein
MDKQEYELIKKKGYEIISTESKERTEIKLLLVFVSDTRKLHDSGYPFIRIFGEIDKNKLIDLGWHDHYIINCSVNIDSLGKNLFRIMPWLRTTIFWINKNPIWCSSFEITSEGELR